MRCDVGFTDLYGLGATATYVSCQWLLDGLRRFEAFHLIQRAGLTQATFHHWRERAICVEEITVVV